MKPDELFSFLKCIRRGNQEQVDKLVRDSRQADRRAVFFAIPGVGSSAPVGGSSDRDGHRFLGEVCGRGVLGVVVERVEAVPHDFNGWVFQSDNARRDWARASQVLFGNPSKDLFIVGVTGTNGKTTTTHMIEWILNQLGCLTGVIGTIDHHVGERIWPTNHTTPDAFDLQSRLQDFVKVGARGAAIEVTSHALDQFRTEGVSFDVGVFTNLTRDHLDYHGTMEKYFEAKHLLFQRSLAESQKAEVLAVINADDEWGKKLRPYPRAKILRYGCSDRVELEYKVRGMSFSGLEVEVFPRFAQERATATSVTFPMMGHFNAENMMAAIGAVIPKLNGKWSDLPSILASFPGVRGRLQRVHNSRGFFPFVDFAHTDDALRRSLETIRTVRSQAKLTSRIVTVFGCGGDRDKGKRALMGAVANSLSDVVVVTSDNPRTEDPQAIIRDILSGIPLEERDRRIHVEADRRKAIALAAGFAKAGDVILVAGKGHETDQILGTTKVPFDDVAVLREVLG